MGERFYPEQYDASYYEHFHRYIIAKEFSINKNVLDVACGEGYGSQMLSMVANKVVGVDINDETIAKAKQKYKETNLEFQTSNISELPFTDHHFDTVISFETIEHITHPEEALKELSRVVKDSGKLIISTPNKLVYSDERDYVNQYHEHEFYLDEFIQMLRKHFCYIKVFGQRMVRSSVIWPIEWNERKVSFTGDDPLTPMYYVVICSNAPIEDVSIASQFSNEYVDSEVDQAKEAINKLISENEKAKTVIDNKEKELKDASKIIDQLVSEKENVLEMYRKCQYEIISAKETIESLIGEKENAKKVIELKEIELNNARKTCDAYKAEVMNAKESITLLVNEKENAKNVIEAKDVELLKAKENIESLLSDTKAANVTFRQLNDEISKAKETIAVILNEKENAKLVIESKDLELVRAKERIESLVSENVDFQNTVSEMERIREVNADLEQKLLVQSEKLNGMVLELEGINGQKESNEKEIEQTKRELEQTKRELEQTSAQLQELKSGKLYKVYSYFKNMRPK
jgi:SAM-dependent methyltransferase